MLKIVMWIAIIAASGYLVICLSLFLQQRSMLYYPTAPVESAEGAVLWLSSDGERLKVFQVERTGGRALIYFGGNAEDVSINLPRFSRLFPGHSLYLHNYRGYGGSSGRPTEEGLVADGIALFDLVRGRHDEVAVIGRSLGSGVAVAVAARRPVDRLVLVTPYASMTKLAAHYYPYAPTRLLLLDRYDSAALAPGLDTDVLVLIAASDEVIPRHVSDALVERLPPDRTVSVVIDGAGHNDIEASPVYERQLQHFLEEQS